MKRLIVVAALALGLAPAAAAAELRPSCPGGGQDCTEYIMEGDEVEGGRASAGIDRVGAGGRAASRSLLRVRTSFVPELVKSVEQI